MTAWSRRDAVCRGRCGCGSAYQPVNLAYSWISSSRLPAGFYKARDITAHGGLTQLVAAQAELAIHGVGATGDPATALLAHWAGVAGQLLELDLGFPALLVGRADAGDGCLELGSLGAVFGSRLGALQFALDH